MAEKQGWAKWRKRSQYKALATDAAIQLIGYTGHRSENAVHIRARVLAEKALPRPGASTWSRMRAMMALYNTEELSNIAAYVEMDGRHIAIKSDDDGHIKMRVPSNAALPPNTDWEAITLNAQAPNGTLVSVEIPIIAPGEAVAVGVISDIDDTILETGTTNFLRNWRRVLIETAEERLAVPGAVKLYRALAGSAAQPVRPFFYVSTSPWNLYPMLALFKHLNGLPAGPMFLTRFHISRRKKRFHRTVEHKSTAINKTLAAYPDMQFVLIGDSAQHDITIYRQAIAQHPGRILAVIIRDVENRAELAENATALTDIAAQNVPVYVAPSLAGATDFLTSEGLGHLLVRG